MAIQINRVQTESFKSLTQCKLNRQSDLTNNGLGRKL